MLNEYNEKNDFNDHSSHMDRMDEVLKNMNIPKKSIVLDVGGGQGMHACFLAQKYAKCYCLDILDYQTLYNGEYYRLFKEKCERNNINYNNEQLRFIENDAMDLLFKDSYFDFVTSFNAFEHIPNPLKALEEMIRVTKKGGVIYNHPKLGKTTVMQYISLGKKLDTAKVIIKTKEGKSAMIEIPYK